MNIIKLENDSLVVEVVKYGAELKSITDKQTGKNIMWCGDSAVWGKTAPNLFPFLGLPRNKEYSFEGVTYPMTRHGFVREVDFEIKQISDFKIVLRYQSTAESLTKYPFKFALEVEYLLSGKKVTQTYRVFNLDKKVMYFQIGGHTSFSTENDGLTLDDYFLTFNKSCEFKAFKQNAKSEFMLDKQDLGTGNILKLSQKMFDEDSLTFHKIGADSVVLESKKSATKVKFDFPDYDNLAVWSPKGCNRFVCLEAWQSIPDNVNSDGELTTKVDIIKLNAEMSKSFTFSIEII